MVEYSSRYGPLDQYEVVSRSEVNCDEHNAEVFLTDCRFRGQIIVRGNTDLPKFADAIERVLGLRPPVKPTTAVGGADFPRLLWLGPDEWLVLTEDALKETTLEQLTETLVGQHFQVVDVSDARAVFGLTGPRARNVLEKGCPLDLHSRVFGAGRSTRTVVGRVQIILHQVTEVPHYDIYVQRSLAEYLWAWLEDARLEYEV